MPRVCEFGKHFQNSLGSRGSGFLCHLCNTKDSKGRRVTSIVRESGKHSQNLLSSGGDVFSCATDASPVIAENLARRVKT